MVAIRVSAAFLVAALIVLQAPAAGRAEQAFDFSGADLTGDWYILVHYKDDRSVDKTITKFKDFAWSIAQREGGMTWEVYPYVMFGDETELLRRAAMVKHKAWEPDETLWQKIKTTINVSSRAAERKRLDGTLAKGFKSLAPIQTGGLNTMSFTRNWKVAFVPEMVKLVITDSLSGGAGLGGMEEDTVYEITERVDGGEFRGRWDADTKRGTFRMVRSVERKVVK